MSTPLYKSFHLRLVLSLLLVSTGVSPMGHSHAADCPWPPLNAVKQRDTQTQIVNGVPFTTGFSSWFVERYHIDHLDCTYQIDTGPKQWRASLPDEVEDRKANRPDVQRGRDTSEGRLPILPPTEHALQPLPPLRALSSTPSQRRQSSTLPALPSLKGNLPALPRNVEPLPTVSQLPALPIIR